MTSLDLTDEDRARAAGALRGRAAHLRQMIDAKEAHVATPTRRAWSYEATECDQLAAKIGRPADQITTYRSAR